jgi:hypothetical protein
VSGDSYVWDHCCVPVLRPFTSDTKSTKSLFESSHLELKLRLVIKVFASNL